ncbi:MAG: ABC transporter permease [Planctomycetaceae bacterium]
MRAAFTLAERELVRFFRQPNRVLGAVLQPLIFWLLFGAAFRGSFRAPAAGQTYQQYFLPGVAVLIALFTAIFSTISIIEDRREGFLQAVLVAPVRRSSMVLGKVMGGTLLAVLQGTLFLLLGPLAGVSLSPAGLLGAAGVLFAVGFALTSLGFCIAWRMDSVQGFHAIMSVFLLPLWLLSGAFFPAEGLPAWLAWVLRLNPLTYGVESLRIALALAPGPAGGPLGVIALFGLVLFGLACLLARRRTRVDLR